MSDIKIIEGSKLIAEYLGWKYIPSNDLQGFTKAGWWRTMTQREALRSVKITDLNKTYTTLIHVCRKHHELRFYNDLNLLFEVIGKIEEEDLSDYGYSWDEGTEKQYNNEGLEFNLIGRKVDFYLNLSLDPPKKISIRKFNYVNLKEKIFEVVVETIEYVNKVKEWRIE